MDWERWRGHIDERFVGLDKANTLAFKEMERRLEQMNELRAQISEERGRYLSVDQYESKHEDLVRRVGVLERAIAQGHGVDTGIADLTRRLYVLVGLIVAAVGVGVSVLAAVD